MVNLPPHDRRSELIHRRAPWKSREAVELATLEGWLGSTTTACWNPSAISRQPRLRQTTTVGSPTEPWKQLNLNPTASTEPGAIQVVIRPLTLPAPQPKVSTPEGWRPKSHMLSQLFVIPARSGLVGAGRLRRFRPRRRIRSCSLLNGVIT